MAAQNAALVLGEEWEAVEVLVEKIMKTGDYERITVADANGVVRAASDSQAGRSALQGPGRRTPGHPRQGGRRALCRGWRAHARLRRAGHLPGTDRRPRDAGHPRGAADRGGAAVDLADGGAGSGHRAGGGGGHVLRRQLVCQAHQAGRRIDDRDRKGRFDHRINEQRKDEFGELYRPSMPWPRRCKIAKSVPSGRHRRWCPPAATLASTRRLRGALQATACPCRWTAGAFQQTADRPDSTAPATARRHRNPAAAAESRGEALHGPPGGTGCNSMAGYRSPLT
jgi:hypothetical protein